MRFSNVTCGVRLANQGDKAAPGFGGLGVLTHCGPPCGPAASWLRPALAFGFPLPLCGLTVGQDGFHREHRIMGVLGAQQVVSGGCIPRACAHSCNAVLLSARYRLAQCAPPQGFHAVARHVKARIQIHSGDHGFHRIAQTGIPLAPAFEHFTPPDPQHIAQADSAGDIRAGFLADERIVARCRSPSLACGNVSKRASAMARFSTRSPRNSSRWFEKAVTLRTKRMRQRLEEQTHIGKAVAEARFEGACFFGHFHADASQQRRSTGLCARADLTRSP